MEALGPKADFDPNVDPIVRVQSHRLRLKLNSYQITDNLTNVWGKDTFTFGEDFRRLQASLTNSDANENGDFTYISDYTSSCTMDPSCDSPVGGNQFASFLLGRPSYLDRGFVATDPATRAILLGIYAQDQYRLTRRLTLNLALRWDLITSAIDKGNRQSNLNLATGVLDFASSGNRGPNVDNYFNGYSPRAGFTYAPGIGNTTVSGAFGVTHFPGNFRNFWQRPIRYSHIRSSAQRPSGARAGPRRG